MIIQPKDDNYLNFSHVPGILITFEPFEKEGIYTDIRP